MLCDVLRVLKQLIVNGLLGIGRMGPELRHHVLLKRSGVLCSSVRFLREHRGDKRLRLLLDAPQRLRAAEAFGVDLVECLRAGGACRKPSVERGPCAFFGSVSVPSETLMQ